jgi:hypothetical protein
VVVTSGSDGCAVVTAAPSGSGRRDGDSPSVLAIVIVY